MKNNQLTTMLVGMLFLSTLASVGFIYKYNASVRAIQRLQPQLAGPTAAQNIMQSLLNDTVEYGKTTKNPDIARILQTVTGGKPQAAAAKPK